MQACSYESGRSGYYKITNNGRAAADVCWTVTSNKGKEDKGCHSNMPAGETTSGVCVWCGARNEGVRSISLDKYNLVR